MIPEYEFEHCICSLNPVDFADANGLQSVYIKCAEFLRFKSRPDVGINVLISPKWMFVCLITQPYAASAHGNPVYLDGLSFAGLVTLQITQATWPETAGLADEQPTVLSSMEKTTFTKAVIPKEGESENPLTNSVEVGNRSGYGTANAASEAAKSMTKSIEK